MTAPTPATRLVLRAYPRSWRQRYGAEMRALVSERRPGWRDLWDLMRGALDARLHPQLAVAPRVLLAAAATGATLPPVATYGVVDAPPIGEMSRRRFMRRVLGLGAALLALEFLGGSIAFFWPQLRGGIGGRYKVGTLAEIVGRQPSFAAGWPLVVGTARSFLVNVPAAKELALGREASVPAPTADQLLALWRKCPHLGCQVPELCDSLKRFTCFCHGSTYNIVGEKLKEGPADRGLDRFAVEIDADGVVVIDTGLIVRGAPDRKDPAYLTFVDAAPYDQKCR
jgi:Rieske Fe-S protein